MAMEFSASIQLNDNMARTSSFMKFRLTLFFGFFFVAIFGVFIITSVLQVNSVTRYICSQLAMPTVHRVEELIEGNALDDFLELTVTLDDTSDYYVKTQKRMLEIKNEIGAQYLYTMVPISDTVYRYIIDGSSTPDDEENFSPIGTDEDVSDYEEAFFATVRTGTPLLGGIDHTELWGNVISAYAPIHNRDGEVIGIIGCDLDADPIIEWIRLQVLWQLGVVAVFIIAAAVVYISLLRRINRLVMYEKEA
jgi:methyl-accepting chemotaxis protein